jgi:hypothetical protein
VVHGEQVVGEIGNPPPAEGCLVRFVTFQTNPAGVDENLAFYTAGSEDEWFCASEECERRKREEQYR